MLELYWRLWFSLTTDLDFYRKEITVNGNPATIEILDTAGIDQFSSMRDLYIRNGHVSEFQEAETEEA